MPLPRPTIQATTPLFVVANLQRSLDFYTQKLGFGAPGVWGEPPGFALVRRDGFTLMLSLAAKPEFVRPAGSP